MHDKSISLLTLLDLVSQTIFLSWAWADKTQNAGNICLTIHCTVSEKSTAALPKSADAKGDLWHYGSLVPNHHQVFTELFSLYDSWKLEIIFLFNKKHCVLLTLFGLSAEKPASLRVAFVRLPQHVITNGAWKPHSFLHFNSDEYSSSPGFRRSAQHVSPLFHTVCVAIFTLFYWQFGLSVDISAINKPSIYVEF